MKPVAYFFVGMPLGALWMALWIHAHLKRAAKQLQEATELYYRAEEIFRKIRDVITTPEAPR